MFADLDYDIEEDKLGIPTVPGKVTLQKDAQNLIGISIGGGAQYCPCLYIVQVFDNTPAALDGTVAAGDEITGVNGRSIKGKTKVEVAKMIQEVKGEVTIHYNKLQADPKQGMSLDIVLKKVKHRLVENMSSGTADALGLSRAILCNDGLVKRLEELERTAELYKGMTEHTKNLLRAFYELSQTHRGGQVGAAFKPCLSCSLWGCVLRDRGAGAPAGSKRGFCEVCRCPPQHGEVWRSAAEDHQADADRPEHVPQQGHPGHSPHHQEVPGREVRVPVVLPEGEGDGRRGIQLHRPRGAPVPSEHRQLRVSPDPALPPGGPRPLLPDAQGRAGEDGAAGSEARTSCSSYSASCPPCPSTTTTATPCCGTQTSSPSRWTWHTPHWPMASARASSLTGRRRRRRKRTLQPGSRPGISAGLLDPWTRAEAGVTPEHPGCRSGGKGSGQTAAGAGLGSGARGGA
ncbi:PRKCA-binding protein isoform X1 [Marmota flaviventris]|uniref:PRKCA-binding protein isoform X1 n=1 Tax=Marmota flaviventris TaxID=93162 RepID=UPI003A89F417